MRATMKISSFFGNWNDFFRFPLNLLSYPFSSNIVNIKSKSFTNMLNAWKDQRKVAPFSLHVSVVRYSGCPVCFLPWKSSVRHLGHHHFSSSYLIFLITISRHFFSYFLIIISHHFFLIFCQNQFWWKVFFNDIVSWKTNINIHAQRLEDVRKCGVMMPTKRQI